MIDRTVLTACASCGAEVPPGARYCPRCGDDAAAVPPRRVQQGRPPKPARKPKPAVVPAPATAAPAFSDWDALAPWPGSVHARTSESPVSPEPVFVGPAPPAPTPPSVVAPAPETMLPTVDSAPAFVPVPAGASDQPAAPPGAQRAGRRRAPAVLLTALVVIALVVASGAAYLLTRPAPHAQEAAAATVGSAHPAASVDPGSTAGATPSRATTPAPAATTAPLTSALSRTQLASYFLGSADLPGAPVHVRPGGDANDWTLSAYDTRYQAQTDPASCRNAKGLMFFGDTDAPSSAGWTRKTIARRNDLALAGSSLVGDQQLRQFPTVQAAQQFMQEQRAWFSTCSDVTYGTDNPVEYHGTVDDETSPDLVLTSATHSGADSNVEFDGWTRVGTVVFAAYLLGNSGTSVQDARSGGRAVMLAAERKLQQGK